jgi:hypothetical protein
MSDHVLPVFRLMRGGVSERMPRLRFRLAHQQEAITSSLWPIRAHNLGKPHCDVTSVSLPRHPAVAYLYLVRPSTPHTMKITLQSLLLCVTLSALPLFGQTAPASEQDVRVVPGTRWIASVTMERDEYVSCQINLNLEDGVQVRYTIGSKGSLVLLLNDKYMEAQVFETLGWTEGQSYRAILFLDDKKFGVQAERIGQHTLLIPLASIDRETVFRAKKMALAVGGIAMRGYDVDGLDIASHELLDSYRQHAHTEKTPSNQKQKPSRQKPH